MKRPESDRLAAPSSLLSHGSAVILRQIKYLHSELTTPGNGPALELDDLIWAAAMHHSRAMRVPVPSSMSCSPIYPSANFVEAMVPLGDMANHDPASMAEWRLGQHLAHAPKRRRKLLLDASDSEAPSHTSAPKCTALLQMMPGANLPAGQPVRIPYGAKDNTELLLRYGFVLGPEKSALHLQVSPGATAPSISLRSSRPVRGPETRDGDCAFTLTAGGAGVAHGVQIVAACLSSSPGQETDGHVPPTKHAASALAEALEPMSSATAWMPKAGVPKRFQPLLEAWAAGQAAVASDALAELRCARDAVIAPALSQR